MPIWSPPRPALCSVARRRTGLARGWHRWSDSRYSAQHRALLLLPMHKPRCWPDGPCKALPQHSQCPVLWPRSTAARRLSRAEAVGAWTGFLMLGFSIGPLLGGALTHITGWRVIFWLNALLMLVALAGMASAGSATIRADGTRGRRIDWIGFILLATFMVALIFGLHEVPDAGAAPLPLVGALLLAVAAFVLLVYVEARAEAPLVDLSFFARGRFVMGVAIRSLSMFSIIGLLLYFNLYAQWRGGLGLTALEAGASLLPLSAALLALAMLAPTVAARVGLRNALTAGMALITIASAVIGAAVAEGSLVLLSI